MNFKLSVKVVSIMFVSAVLVACSEKSEPQATPAVPALSVPAPVPPSVVAQKYEGKIVRQAPDNRGKEDGWYLVKDGKRKWITDGAWLEKNGFKAEEVMEISSADFNAIEEDPMPLE